MFSVKKILKKIFFVQFSQRIKDICHSPRPGREVLAREGEPARKLVPLEQVD